jgi:phosphate transport system substrate-binding protein
MMKKSNFYSWLLTASTALFLSGVVGLNQAQSAEERLRVTGAGATFPYPLYLKWMSEFQKVFPRFEMNYQSIGSGAGIKQLLKNVIHYGASDSPMKDEQLKEAKIPVLHFPTVLGAVAITYRLSGLTEPLKFTPEVLADLFLGKIYYWNDPRIQNLNPTQNLPKIPTMVVYRADGSGTSAVFTEYLSKISPTWKEKVGSGTSVKWPVGIGGKGNEGVTGFVKNFEGALGYVELLYAEKNHLPAAKLQNREGEFVAPTFDSIASAADAYLAEIPADFRISITNAPGKASYPIASFTYLLIYQKNPTAFKEALKSYLTWIYSSGQILAKALYYVPLPESLLEKVKKQIVLISDQDLAVKGTSGDVK